MNMMSLQKKSSDEQTVKPKQKEHSYLAVNCFSDNFLW